MLPPAAYLRYCDAAFLCQLFFGFFTGVRVTEVGVKILIQDFCGLFTEVAPFPPEKRQENHSCSRRAELPLSRGVGTAPIAHPQHAAPSAAAWPCGLHAKGCSTRLWGRALAGSGHCLQPPPASTGAFTPTVRRCHPPASGWSQQQESG